MNSHCSAMAGTVGLAAGLLLILACGGGDDGDDITGPDGDVDVMSQLGPALVTELGNLSTILRLPSGPPGCLTVTPLPFPDSDGDGVPDSAHFAFDETGCTFVFTGGSGTSWGTIDVTDPGASFGFSTLHAVSHAISTVDPPSTRTLTINGTRTVGGTPTRLTLSEDIQLAFSMTGKPASAATERWTAVFTPEDGSSVVFGLGVPLPSGQIDLAGTLIWMQEGITVTLAVSTAVPIAIDTACESPFPVAGEVRFQVTSGAAPGYVSVRFTGCGGEMEVDWVPAG